MRLLVDVCLSTEWIPFLAKRGVEAVHWSSVGPRSADDEVIFAHAAEHGYVIFTHDLDFGTLLALTAASVARCNWWRPSGVASPPQAKGKKWEKHGAEGMGHGAS